MQGMRGRVLLGVFGACLGSALLLSACADVSTPGARTASIPSPAMADPRPEAVNEQPDSVLYLPLGSDVLVPAAATGGKLPDEIVGPFEFFPGGVFRVTTEDDVRTPTGHVGRNGDRAFSASLGDQLRFMLLLFRVQYVVVNTIAIQFAADFF